MAYLLKGIDFPTNQCFSFSSSTESAVLPPPLSSSIDAFCRRRICFHDSSPLKVSPPPPFAWCLKSRWTIMLHIHRQPQNIRFSKVCTTRAPARPIHFGATQLLLYIAACWSVLSLIQYYYEEYNNECRFSTVACLLTLRFPFFGLFPPLAGELGRDKF